jgi:hypothetical protein
MFYPAVVVAVVALVCSVIVEVAARWVAYQS